MFSLGFGGNGLDILVFNKRRILKNSIANNFILLFFNSSFCFGFIQHLCSFI